MKKDGDKECIEVYLKERYISKGEELMSVYHGDPTNNQWIGPNQPYQQPYQIPQPQQWQDNSNEWNDWIYTSTSFGTIFTYELILVDCTAQEILNDFNEQDLLKRAVLEATLTSIVDSTPEHSLRNKTKVFKGKLDAQYLQQRVEHFVKEAPEYRLAYAIGKLNSSPGDVTNALIETLTCIMKDTDRYVLNVRTELKTSYHSQPEKKEYSKDWSQQIWPDNSTAQWIVNPGDSGNTYSASGCSVAV